MSNPCNLRCTLGTTCNNEQHQREYEGAALSIPHWDRLITTVFRGQLVLLSYIPHLIRPIRTRLRRRYQNPSLIKMAIYDLSLYGWARARRGFKHDDQFPSLPHCCSLGLWFPTVVLARWWLEVPRLRHVEKWSVSHYCIVHYFSDMTNFKIFRHNLFLSISTESVHRAYGVDDTIDSYLLGRVTEREVTAAKMIWGGIAAAAWIDGWLIVVWQSRRR